MIDYIEVETRALKGLDTSQYKGERVHVWGSVDVMSRPAIGVCGSRKASEKGLEYAYELGRVAAEAGITVVSGYAPGVDFQAHLGAMEGGGATVAVLPEGIEYFSVRVGLRGCLRKDNFLALSCYPPRAKWTPWRAMERNRVILSLVDAMFVVEAGETGGTYSAGVDAIKMGKPLYVLDRPSTQGNQLLMRHSAQTVRTIRELKSAILDVASGDVRSRTLL